MGGAVGVEGEEHTKNNGFLCLLGLVGEKAYKTKGFFVFFVFLEGMYQPSAPVILRTSLKTTGADG